MQFNFSSQPVDTGVADDDDDEDEADEKHKEAFKKLSPEEQQEKNDRTIFVGNVPLDLSKKVCECVCLD